MARLNWKLFKIIVVFLTLCLIYYVCRSYTLRPSLSAAIKRPSSIVQPSSSPVIPSYRVSRISCKKLFENDDKEQKKALETTQTYRGFIQPDNFYVNIDCPKFIKQRSYITSAMTDEEANFPIAYSIVVFKELGQVERLFRAIYRPQNYYCFHVDKKSSRIFRQGVQRLISCFPDNVIISSRSVDVKWGWWSVIDADLACMKDLLDRFPKWKYLINLTGQEFPLRTNLELVRILKAFNGSNNIEGTIKRLNPGRAPSNNRGLKIKWLKGSLHVVAVRSFINFLFDDKKARLIMDILRERPFPDEMLFTTLNHNPQLGAPGAYLGTPETGDKYPFITRLKNWGDGPFNYPCRSQLRVRQICIWGIKDLPFIDSRYELFVNKFYWHFQPFTLDCMEERFFNNTHRDYGLTSVGRGQRINLDFYRSFEFVKNHL